MTTPTNTLSLDEIRAQAEGMIARALRLVVDAGCDCLDRWPGAGHAPDCKPARAYTDEELEELLFCLTMAAVKLKKLPGGQVAYERTLARAEAELGRRRKAVEAACDHTNRETCRCSCACGGAMRLPISHAQGCPHLVVPGPPEPTHEEQLADIRSARIEAGQLFSRFVEIDRSAAVESCTIVYHRAGRTFHAVIHDATRYDPPPSESEAANSEGPGSGAATSAPKPLDSEEPSE